MLNIAMKERWETEFNEARLTLEVQDFTTKDLGSVARLLAENNTERNFYASMFRNHIFIAGSKEVYDRFVKVIKDYIDDPENDFLVAERTYNQFLGDTDKGSIKVIEHLGLLKNVTDACGQYLPGYIDRHTKLKRDEKVPWKDEVLHFFLTLTKQSFNHWAEMGPVAQKAWVTSPIVFYKLLGQFNDIAYFLHGKKDVKNALAILKKAEVFPSLTSGVQLLQRVAKVVKVLTDDEGLDSSGSDVFKTKNWRGQEEKKEEEKDEAERKEEEKKEEDLYHPIAYQQCGSTLSTKDRWCFNIKFVGCRLSDWFDAVPFDDFRKWKEATRSSSFRSMTTSWVTATPMNVDDIGKIYDLAKKIAGIVNRFALSLQTTIYLVSSFRLQPNVAIADRHKTIDNLYSRVTKADFEEIMLMSGGRSDVDILKPIVGLNEDLKAIHEEGNMNETMKEAVKLVVEKAGSVLKYISMPSTNAESKEFFEALFQLVKAVAESLVVPVP
jgi:hypothetical protein